MVDFLQKQPKKNEGEVQQYYVEGYEAIISSAVYDMVKTEHAKRTKEGTRYSGVGIFSNKTKCADCGGWYGNAGITDTNRNGTRLRSGAFSLKGRRIRKYVIQ